MAERLDERLVRNAELLVAPAEQHDRARRRAARRANSDASRVLPMPGSPAMSTQAFVDP